MKTFARCLAATGAMLLSTGCVYVGDWGPSDAYRQDFHSTHPLDAGGRVSVESYNGSVEVVGWEQNSVEINGTKYASHKYLLDEMKIDVDASAGSVHVRAVRPGDVFRNTGVRFSIRVPRKAVLDMVSTSNGKLDVNDVEGNARLRTSNGAIRLVRVKGDVEARTSNGNIEVEDVSGNANLHTSNGSIRAETSRGSFEATTSNGRIVASLKDPANTWPVRLRSSNGHIELTLDTRQVPDVHVSTSNSSILLRMPADVNARVHAHTSRHSGVNSEFGELHGDTDHSRGEVEGTIGRGGALVDLETSNGSIKITKL